MFPGGYFAKTYFAGTYWPPVGEGDEFGNDGLFAYPILRRRARR